MTLQEFLATASPHPNQALAEAQAYEIIEPAFITSNTLTVYVVQAGLYDVFSDVANNPESPVRGICMALMDRLRGQSEFNLSQSLPLGQANLAMLNTLIQALPQHSVAISNLRDVLLSVSNRVVRPFANTTLHDVLVARGECLVKPVTVIDGWVVITTTADCPKHNPRLLAVNSRTGKWQRINNFYGVAEAGSYEAQVPREWFGAELAVDDAYGVM